MEFKIKLVIVFGFLVKMIYSQQNFPHPSNDPNWILVFEDDFSSPTINTSKWFLYNGENFGFGESSWSNDANHISIENNKLKLTATYENTPHFGRNFVGGYVRTHRLFQQNDYVEASCKVTTIGGSFPAAWIWYGLGDCSLNDYREIDFMEHFGYYQNSIQTGIHYCDDYFQRHSVENEENGETKFTLNFPVSSGGFYTYSTFWGKADVNFYMNNHLINHVKNNGKVVSNGVLALNQAVGRIGHLSNSPYPPATNFPISMYVDWVKAYTLKCGNNSQVINEINNFSTYNYSVKKSITMSNQTSFAGSPANISLMAEDFIELKEGFEIPNNKNFALTIVKCNN